MFRSVWVRLYLPHLVYLAIAAPAVSLANILVLFAWMKSGLWTLVAPAVAGALISATWFYLKYYILRHVPSLAPDDPDRQRKLLRMGGLLFYVLLAGSLLLWVIGNTLDSPDNMTEYTGWAVIGYMGTAATLFPSLVYAVSSVILPKRLKTNGSYQVRPTGPDC